MSLPLSLGDLSLWAAITSVILLTTAEILSPNYGRTKIMINHRRLRIIAYVVTLVFLITVTYRIYQIVTNI